VQQRYTTLETQTQIKVEMTVIWGMKPLCYKTPNVLKNQLLIHVCLLANIIIIIIIIIVIIDDI